jgi:hypothetical protein
VQNVHKVSLILEDTLAAGIFAIGVGMALFPVLALDEQPPRQRIYSNSFLRFPSAGPVADLSKPLRCDATVVGRSPGEVPKERCYIRKSQRNSK